jgi:hypothetical protein
MQARGDTESRVRVKGPQQKHGDVEEDGELPEHMPGPPEGSGRTMVHDLLSIPSLKASLLSGRFLVQSWPCFLSPACAVSP